MQEKMAGGKPIEPIDYESLRADEKQFLKQLQETFNRIPPQEREILETKVDRFLAGEISWAEFDSYPPELLLEIARMGQSFVDLNRFKEAETIFKGLAILDHKNYFYRGMLGSLYQKQKAYVDAISEYSLAVELNPKDIASYTNRGECWQKLGMHADALADFEMAKTLGDEKAMQSGQIDRFANRARILHKNLLDKLSKDPS